MSDSHPFKSAAHILSAGTWAVISDPNSYKTISDNVNKLLDLAYAADDTWNKHLKRRQVYLPGPQSVNRMHIKSFRSRAAEASAQPVEAKKSGWLF